MMVQKKYTLKDINYNNYGLIKVVLIYMYIFYRIDINEK